MLELSQISRVYRRGVEEIHAVEDGPAGAF